jgi:hypothetical protein
MKKTINFYEFEKTFEDSGRGNQFSYSGLKVLYDYLTDLEEETGEELELDVIAICCDFTEYENIEEFQVNYGKGYSTIEEIEAETIVIPIDDDSFIIQNF